MDFDEAENDLYTDSVSRGGVDKVGQSTSNHESILNETEITFPSSYEMNMLPSANDLPSTFPTAEDNEDALNFIEFVGDMRSNITSIGDEEVDITGDGGVIVKRISSAGSSTEPSKRTPCKDSAFVELHYEGYIKETDYKFDSSRDLGYPLIAHLDFSWKREGNLVKGLDMALRVLSIGDKVRINLSSKYAYGEEGCAPDIPPNSDLYFEVEILDIRRSRKKQRVEETQEFKDSETVERLKTASEEREIMKARRIEIEEKKKERAEATKHRLEELKQKLAEKQNRKGKKKKKGRK